MTSGVLDTNELPVSSDEYLPLTYDPTPSLIFAAYADDSAEPNSVAVWSASAGNRTR